MFDIGFLELLIIGVVGLLVLGPERLPKAARTAGLWIGKIKRTVSGMQREITSQLEAEELRQKLEEQQKKLDDSLNKVKRDVESIAEPESKDAPAADTSQSEKSAQGKPEHAAPESATSRLDKALTHKADRDSAADTQAMSDTAPPRDKDSTSR